MRRLGPSAGVYCHHRQQFNREQQKLQQTHLRSSTMQVFPPTPSSQRISGLHLPKASHCAPSPTHVLSTSTSTTSHAKTFRFNDRLPLALQPSASASALQSTKIAVSESPFSFLNFLRLNGEPIPLSNSNSNPEPSAMSSGCSDLYECGTKKRAHRGGTWRSPEATMGRQRTDSRGRVHASTKAGRCRRAHGPRAGASLISLSSLSSATDDVKTRR